MMAVMKKTILCSLIAAVIGAVMGVISGVFGCAIEFITEIREEYYLYLTPFLGAAGIAVIFLYKKFSPYSQQGLDLAIEYQMGGVDEKGVVKDFGHARKIGKFPKGYAVLKIFNNLIMLLFGASTGKEGTIAQCGAAVGDYASRIFKSRKYSQILLISGVSAALGGLFQTPLGGLFFALEFAASGVLFYEAVIPALISAYASCFISKLCGYSAFSFAVGLEGGLEPLQTAMLVIGAAAFGLIGRGFAELLGKARELYKKRVKDPYIGIFAVGCVMAAALIFLHGGRYSGAGENIIYGIFADGEFYIYDFALKLVFTVICVSVGYTGGEMTPLIAIGAAAGAALAQVSGLPFGLSAAAGAAAVYGAATNTLLAPIFIGIELFGGDTALYIALSCVIAFAVNGNRSIYSSQRHIIRSFYSVLKK